MAEGDFIGKLNEIKASEMDMPISSAENLEVQRQKPDLGRPPRARSSTSDSPRRDALHTQLAGAWRTEERTPRGMARRIIPEDLNSSFRAARSADRPQGKAFRFGNRYAQSGQRVADLQRIDDENKKRELKINYDINYPKTRASDGASRRKCKAQVTSQPSISIAEVQKKRCLIRPPPSLSTIVPPSQQAG